ncbi:MAG: Ig-like domain-containing protein, partial [Nocardioidaceae bacterium]|nr:Ig-like domain-containing protein [Nocardioidaceae bacterium]
MPCVLSWGVTIAVVVVALLFLGLAPSAAVAAVGDTLTLSPATDTNTVGQQHCVTAHLTLAPGSKDKVKDVDIRFTVTGANPTTGTVKTNGSGQAQFCYIGNRAGVDTITAYADQNNNGSPSVGEPVAAPASKVWVAAAPNTVTLTPVADENPVGEEHCVTATVTDRFGNPVPNATLRFTVTGSNPRTGVRTTNTGGQATFCYTGTNAGLDTIRAYADTNNNSTQDTGEPAGTATKTYVDQAVGTVTVTPATDTNAVGEQHCVTATARTASGRTVAGVTVFFRVAGANAATGVVATDASGQAVFCYTGTNAGTDTITATADADKDGTPENSEPTGTATKIYLPGAPNTVAITPPTDTNTVGDEHCVTATVTDSFGNRVGAGVRVAFAVTGANPDGGAATTGADGTARFCYTGENAGLDTITSYADTNASGGRDTGEPEGAATKLYVAGPPDRVTLDPAAAQNRVGETHCVTATVTDQFGNATAGAEVTFAVTGANGTADTVTVATGPQGDAEFCYTGQNAGADTIRAFVDENDNGAFDPEEPTAVATKTYT